MTFNIIKRRKNPLGLITISQWIVFSSLIFVYSVTKIFPDWSNVSLIITTFFILFAGIYSFFDYEKLNSDSIGKLVFEKDYLIINNEKILSSEIQNIEIHALFYRGKRRFPSSLAFFGPWKYIGKGNLFTVILNPEKKLKGEFQILNEVDILRLELFQKNFLKKHEN